MWSELHSQNQVPGYQLGTFRTVSPIQTLRRVKTLLKPAGITRVARVTDLDKIGIPVYQSIRPNSRNISVSQGKGLTRAQARVSAVMESLEGFHAEEIRVPSIQATPCEISGQISYDLKLLPSPRRRSSYMVDENPGGEHASHELHPGLNSDLKLEWIEAVDLLTGLQTWVPRQLCELDFTVNESMSLFPFTATSNGLASGNSMVEAIIHGLCEVIERDSFLANADNKLKPEWTLRLETVTSPYIRSVLDRLDRAGIQTSVVDVAGPTGLPVFEATISGSEPQLFKGFGCHPNRDTALLRAVTEAIQSRLTHIVGSREDVYRHYFTEILLPRGFALPLDDHDIEPVKAERHYEDCAHLTFRSWTDAMTEIAERVTRQTGVTPVVVDLRRPDFGIPVVFVVAPGLASPGLKQ